MFTRGKWTTAQSQRTCKSIELKAPQPKTVPEKRKTSAKEGAF
jgi:hypothetical protein